MMLFLMTKKVMKIKSILVLILFLSSCSALSDKTVYLLDKKTGYIDNSTVISEYKYDDLNNLVEEFVDGKLFRTYKYDNDNNIVEVVWEDGKIINEYANSLMVTSKVYALDGSVVEETSYEYGADNLKTKKITTNAEGVVECNYTYDKDKLINEKCIFNEETSVEYKHEYDNDNIYKTEIFKNDVADQIIINEYKNNLKIQAEYTMVNQNVKIYEFYEYDKNNNLIKLYMQENDNPKKLIEEYSYIAVNK